MRPWWLGLVVGMLGCPRTPAPTPVEPAEATARDSAPPASAPPDRVTEPDEAPPVADEPAPTLTFVGDGWVRRADDPSGPLLRLITLRPRGEGSVATEALLGVLEPLMTCYEAELARDPQLRMTLSIQRGDAASSEDQSLHLHVGAPGPNGLQACAEPLLRQALPPAAEDPRGRYQLRMFPRSGDANRLRAPDLTEQVIERPPGVCWTRRTYPCKPGKRCKAPDWERTQCRHPADRPGVALRWVLGDGTDGRRPIVGLALVGADGEIWQTPLGPEDAQRLGMLDDADAQSPSLPKSWSVAMEDDRIMVTDRAGVRVYDRRTGAMRFRYAPPDPEVPRMWFDGGSFTARKGTQRCKGDARHGSFVARCGTDLLYFDGYALAVIAVESEVSLRGQRTTEDKGSTHSGSAVHPVVTLKAAGYRLKVEGMVYMR